MVTIKEIAKSVGVSSATVSRVLNYDATLSISETKRQAILETAEALNYLTPRNRARAQHPPVDTTLPRIAILHFLKPEEELADPYSRSNNPSPGRSPASLRSPPSRSLAAC